MENFKPNITKLLWVAAIVFALYRIGANTNFGLGAIEGLMVLIAAFVAHKTLDLLIPTKTKERLD